MIVDKAFNETKALVKVVNTIKELANGSGLEKYCIIHAGVADKAYEFAQLTTETLGQKPAFIEPVSTAIGLHAGQGCIAIAAMMH